MGLLAVPRTYQSGRRRRSEIQGIAHGPPRASSAATGPTYSGAARLSGVSSPIVVLSGKAEAADRVVGRIEPAEHRERVTSGGSVPAGERLDSASVIHRAERRQRHDEKWPGCLNGRRDEALGRNDLEAGGKVEPPTQPCLGDQRVEHRPRRSPRPDR